ncbi:Aldo/keto reductase [Cucurbitaria berberidis CBS 394.84]|uniref:Aldo/keto reductase n=1 Tax=Cucurbitaria berberidis CBS 394.84 TaxID=1168544 RepID=A0A9P4GBH2_9PLEO|nr:Aldo/keto reductase [Cucurbitaria berberidis CBS 394.84]KAF1842382.1 Aldo/keto reductase [Cucurbitaria berberidis CBS 394.84]
MSAKTELPIIFGAMTFGREGEGQVRTSNLSDCAAILDTLRSHGHAEVDTSRFYGNGSSEEWLGALKWKERGLILDTKFFPNTGGWFGRAEKHLTLPDMQQALDASLQALGTTSVDLWYLHAPDRSVPIEQTLSGVHALFQQGKFTKWGLSNFMAWEVSAICEICLRNAYPLPSVYQGSYNALYRTVENELLPCLRKYKIAFYAFGPLAGGWLTSRYRRDTAAEGLEAGSRFDPSHIQGRMYRERYWNDSFFDALELLRNSLKAEGGAMTESEAALRWMMHHSQLKRELGDKVIVGASSQQQLEMNLVDLEKGSLPDGVIEAFNQGWDRTRGLTWKYFH